MRGFLRRNFPCRSMRNMPASARAAFRRAEKVRSGGRLFERRTRRRSGGHFFSLARSFAFSSGLRALDASCTGREGRRKNFRRTSSNGSSA